MTKEEMVRALTHHLLSMLDVETPRPSSDRDNVIYIMDNDGVEWKITITEE